MGNNKKLLAKLENETIKKAELETLLKRVGFNKIGGKGSHEVWFRAGFDPITIATHSKEIKPYQQKQVKAVLKKGGLL
ncbi:type II toxin-antitoxin system HicA family toxin [Deltaproteobacteria bacterium PRO3]|nr:type II toxin-antitoxin system HicA family toxin [Deltaproteobacteria bacterium PRO3]